MLEYFFLKMCKLRFINWFRIIHFHGTGEKTPKTECKASFLLPVNHKALMNSPTFLPASLPAGLSEKYHLIFPGLVSLASVDTTNYTYQPLEIQVTPISETCSFPDDCSRGAVSHVPCCVLCADGRFGHVRHQLPHPDSLLMQNRSLPLHRGKARH